MNTESPFTEEDVARAGTVATVPQMVATASYQGLRVIQWFYRCYIHPRLRALAQPSPIQLALKALSMRLASSLAALVALDSVAQINGVAVISRSILEIWLDLRAMDRAVYPDSASKFWTFVRTERLRMARQAVAFDDAHPGVLAPAPQAQRAFIASEAISIDAGAQQLWGYERPKHWSGTADIRQRAAAVALEHRYVDLYAQLSNYSHGGAAAVEGLTLDAFHALAHLCHNIAAEAAIDSFRILDRHCAVGSGVEGFEPKVSFLEHVIGLVFTDLRLMSLGEPQRLNLTVGPCPDTNASGGA